MSDPTPDPAPNPGSGEWEALLGTIVADPADDLPRLVAADWLDENAAHFDGRNQQSWAKRAELIRVQCELARLAPAEPGHATLARHERRLLSNFQVDRLLWAMEACPQLMRLEVGDGSSAMSGLVLTSPAECTFRRGFVEVVKCPAADWLAHGPAVRRRQPILEVKLTQLRDLTASECWRLRASLAGVALVRLELTGSALPAEFFREALAVGEW